MSANSRYLAPKVPGGLLMSTGKEFSGNEELFLQLLADLSYSTGDILYWNGAQLINLGIGSPGDVLTVSGGIPAWGSGSGFAGSSELSTTTPNGSQRTFAFTHAPRMIFWSGKKMVLTAEYTVSVNNITFVNDGAHVPQTGDTVENVYG